MVRDKRLFEQVFRENYTRLYYHALNFLNDSEGARDVVNDVFEYVWTHYEQYHFDTSIVPLLYTLVRNQAINVVRHRNVEAKFQKKVLEKPDLYDQDYSGYEELIQRLRNAVAELPPQTQNVFKACFLEGKKYQEVAAELEISINTVKTHISKALRILREEFAGENLILFIIRICRFLF